MKKVVKKVAKRTGAPTVKAVVMPFERLLGVMRKYYELPEEDYIKVVYGTMFANRLDSVPVWLYLVGQAGGGKTEVLKGISAHPSSITISRWTEQTMVSGKGKQGTKGDCSLLPELDGKVLIIKDFTSSLSMSYKTALSILGEPRDAFDGACSKAFGTKSGDSVVKSYTSKFGLIAAVTHSIDRYSSTVGDLGERALIYRMPVIDTNSKLCFRMCMKAIEQRESEKDAEIIEAAKEVLDQEMPPATMTDQQTFDLSDAANVSSKLRTVVHRDHRTKEITEKPVTEVPARLIQQLCNLTKGIAMAQGRAEVSNEDVRLVQKTAIHSCTLMRRSLVEHMLKLDRKMPAEWFPINDLLRSWGALSESQVRTMLLDLAELKVVEMKSYITTKNREGLDWRITQNKLEKGILNLLVPVKRDEEEEA